MRKQTVNHFDNVNSFYSEYYSLLNQKNVETALQTARDNIIKEVCCIFYLDDNYHTILDEAYNHTQKKENKEYSLEIFEITLACLKTFDKKDFSNDEADDERVAKKEKNFAKYVTSSINRKLKYLKAQTAIENNNAMKIPREKINLIRKIKTENEHLSRMITNPETRAEQIKMKLNISDDYFNILLPMALHTKVSLDSQISSEKEESKTLIDFIAAEFSTAEELLENKENFTEFLTLIQNEWEKKHDTEHVLSDALTVDILGKMFGTDSGELDSKIDTIDNNEYYLILKKYSCFNIDIITEYFTNPSYKLPNQTAIGQIHNGLTKAAISKKLSRFYDKIRAYYNNL